MAWDGSNLKMPKPITERKNMTNQEWAERIPFSDDWLSAVAEKAVDAKNVKGAPIRLVWAYDGLAKAARELYRQKTLSEVEDHESDVKACCVHQNPPCCCKMPCVVAKEKQYYCTCPSLCGCRVAVGPYWHCCYHPSHNSCTYAKPVETSLPPKE